MDPFKTTAHFPVRLRDAQAGDLPTLFAFENDIAWREMAKVKPRSRAAFEAVWEKVFQDRAAGVVGVVQKAILADDILCGTIGCRLVDGAYTVGYGLGREYWGKGIASRALALLLAELPLRPLQARAAASNAASIRVLEKNGFVIESTQASPETERNLACDEVRMVL